MQILSIESLSHQFGHHRVLDDISFEIDTPGIYALVGPNGSGKTTLMNIIMNLLKPTTGEITILGQSNQEKSLLNRISFLKDNTILYPYLTGYDHLSYATKSYGAPMDRLDEVGERIGIKDYWHKQTGTYSLGMKQHLLIALAILNNPELLILDEPLNGLDPTSIIRMRELLLEFAEEGKTILLSSHTLSEVDALTNQILFLKDGKIIYERLDYQVDNQRVLTEDRYRELFYDKIYKVGE